MLLAHRVLNDIGAVAPYVVALSVGLLGWIETHRMNHKQFELNDDTLAEMRSTQLIEGYKNLLPATMASYEARLRMLAERIEELKSEVYSTKSQYEVELKVAQGHVENCESQLKDFQARLKIAETKILELGG